jgi:hypothetical protein
MIPWLISDWCGFAQEAGMSLAGSAVIYLLCSDTANAELITLSVSVAFIEQEKQYNFVTVRSHDFYWKVLHLQGLLVRVTAGVSNHGACHESQATTTGTFSQKCCAASQHVQKDEKCKQRRWFLPRNLHFHGQKDLGTASRYRYGSRQNSCKPSAGSRSFAGCANIGAPDCVSSDGHVVASCAIPRQLSNSRYHAGHTCACVFWCYVGTCQ